jgi:hypothetical protein
MAMPLITTRMILFIATKDSDEGKALADKLGKRRQVTNIRINGVNKDMDKLTLQEGALISALPGVQVQGSVKNVTIRAVTLPPSLGMRLERLC